MVVENLDSPDSEIPTVSIILLNWNNFKDTAKCIRSLEAIEYPRYEVVVVDNGSTDHSDRKLQTEFPWCKFVLNNENLGFAAGCNSGIEFALTHEFDYVLLLNNDTTVEPDFLDHLVETAESKENIAAVSGIIEDNETKNIYYAGGSIIPQIVKTKFKTSIESRSAYRTGFITGACMLLSKEFIKQYGMLSEEYFFATEDLEISYRALQNNYHLYINPNSKIYHSISSTSGSNNAFRYYHATRNRLTFASQHLSYRQMPVFCSFLILSRLFRFFQWIIHNRPDLIKATLLAIYDYMKKNDFKEPRDFE